MNYAFCINLIEEKRGEEVLVALDFLVSLCYL